MITAKCLWSILSMKNVLTAKSSVNSCQSGASSRDEDELQFDAKARLVQEAVWQRLVFVSAAGYCMRLQRLLNRYTLATMELE